MGLDSRFLPPHIASKLPSDEKKRLGKTALTYPEAIASQETREEKQLQRLIAELFRLHGIEANRSRMDRKKTDVVGWPDFVCSLNGNAVAVEVKIPGRKLDADQERVRERMISAPNGWKYFVAYSVADVVAILRQFKVIA